MKGVVSKVLKSRFGRFEVNSIKRFSSTEYARKVSDQKKCQVQFSHV